MHCVAEYERVFERPWNHAEYGSLDDWQRRYDSRRRINEKLGRTVSELKGLRDTPGLRKVHPALAEWADEALAEIELVERLDVPASLRAFIIDALETSWTWADIEPDTRRKARRRSGPPTIRWGGARRRALRPRELAYITLLIGLEPALGHCCHQPEEVVRMEAKAIAEILRRK